MTSDEVVNWRPSTPMEAKLRQAALDLFQEHRLIGWTFGFDNRKRVLGLCNEGRRTISLSRRWIAVRSYEESHETILHEIAHALAGAQHKHDAVWKAHARRLGLSNPRSCTQTDVLSGTAPWEGSCSRGHVTEAWRSPKRVSTCGVCSRRFNFAHVITWKKHGKQVAMRPEYMRELLRLQADHAKLTTK